MEKKYIREIVITSITIFVCVFSVLLIKNIYFKNTNAGKPIEEIVNHYKQDKASPTIVQATTRELTTTITKELEITKEDEEIFEEEIVDVGPVPYEVPPTFEDDGSIIYDGLTMTELTDKLNRSLNSYMKNTGYFFADYTRKTGLDPYLAVSIVLLESGCKWSCSYLTVKCNNIGGLKGSPSCNGGSYRRYDTLEEGINGYLDIIYNNYYLKGMRTADQMASKYAESSTWSEKVNNYINEIKSK